MKGSDARERVIAAFVSDALARALFDELIGPDRTRTAKLALNFCLPSPTRRKIRPSMRRGKPPNRN